MIYNLSEEANESKSEPSSPNSNSIPYDNESIQLDFFDIKFSELLSGDSKKRCVEDFISHLLAHTIRDQDTDKFIYLYDKIPDTFSQLKVTFLFLIYLSL